MVKQTMKIVCMLAIMCLMALHCAVPNLPVFQFSVPQNASFVAETLPYSLDLDVGVPMPGCGATTFPIDPATFTANLKGLLDGEVVSEQDVTSAFGEGVVDPVTGKVLWSGSLELPDYGEYDLDVSVSNDNGEGFATLSVRAEQPAADFAGGTFYLGISDIKQIPANCFIANFLINVIKGLIGGVVFPLDLPSGADILASGNAYPATINLPSPLAPVDVVLSVDDVENDIFMDGPEDYTLDFTGLVPLAGFDCIITARADGVFDDLDPDDLDGSLTIEITDVQASPGGTCTLSTPSGDCELIVEMDAQ